MMFLLKGLIKAWAKGVFGAYNDWINMQIRLKFDYRGKYYAYV